MRLPTIKKILFVLGALFVVGAVFVAGSAWAQSVDLRDGFGGFSTQDLKITVENIVRIVLGFIGIIFILLLLYGGIVWMTSGGVPDKINKAKKIIVAAIIGLLIVMTSYAISRFVIESLIEANNGGPPGSAVCGNGVREGAEQCDHGLGSPTCSAGCTVIPGSGSCPAPAPGVVKVCSVTSPANLNQAITIIGHNFGAIAGTVEINGTLADVVVCSGAPSWGPGSITVVVNPATLLSPPISQNVIVTRDDGVACDPDPLVNNCGSTFVDNGVSPYILCMRPDNGPSDGTQSITLTGDNFGVDGRGVVHMEGLAGTFDITGAAGGPLPLLTPLYNISSWMDEEIIFTVPDVSDPEQAITGPVFVKVEPPGPGSGIEQDSNTQWFTARCPGGSGTECATGCCIGANVCADPILCAVTGPTDPFITNVSPNDAGPGNYVTIFGRNFGATPGILHFWDDSTAPSGGTEFINPKPQLAACSATWWSDTQIVMEVPEPPLFASAAVQGVAQIQVTNTFLGLDSNVWDTFEVNTTDRPGLCSVAPATGIFETPFTVTGNNFVSPLDIFFGSPGAPESAINQSYIAPATIATGQVPNLLPISTTVAVETNPGTPLSQLSNPLNFIVGSTGISDPVIHQLDPVAGPTDQYVTIVGRNFGNIVGVVDFIRNSDGYAFRANTSFPPICGTDWWRDDNIVVKVPEDDGGSEVMGVGPYYLRVTRSSDSAMSQPSPITGVNEFTKNTDNLKPGLCKIDPVSGPVSTLVDLYGENFGAGPALPALPPPPMDVLFFDNQSADRPTSPPDPFPFLWSISGQQILNAGVPAGATDGLVRVQPDGGATYQSNGIAFRVGECTSVAQCPGGGAPFACCSGVCRDVGFGGTCDDTTSGDNDWDFTSGQLDFDLIVDPRCVLGIQSPSPYSWDQDTTVTWDISDITVNAPVNVAVAGKFTKPIVFETITGADATPSFTADDGIGIYRCSGSGSWAGCLSGTPVTANGRFVEISNTGFQWEPLGGFEFDHDSWYEVRLDEGGTGVSRIRSQNNDHYKGSIFDAPIDTVEFRWHFHTRLATQDRCIVSTVGLTPPILTVPVESASAFMTASPISGDCNICSGNFEYAWECQNNYTIPPPFPAVEYARFNGVNDFGVDNLFCTPDDVGAPITRSVRFYGKNITPIAPPDLVTATITNDPSGSPIPTATPAELRVVLVPPYVTAYGPTNECSAICLNAIPWANFNVSLEPGSESGAYLYKCSDPTCAPTGLTLEVVKVDLGTWGSNPNDRFDIYPWDYSGGGIGVSRKLLPNTHYRVVLKQNQITDTQGQPLDRLNFDFDEGGPLKNYYNPADQKDSYSWTFETSFEVCDPDSLEVQPHPSTLYSVGANRNYNGRARYTDPSCGVIYLNPYAYNWNWTSNITFASITNTASAVAPFNVLPNQTATSIAPTPLLPFPTPTVIFGDIVTPAVPAGLAELYIYDLRNPISLIEFTPDQDPPGIGLGANPDPIPGASNMCRNLLVSATMDYWVNSNSITTFSSDPLWGAAAYWTFDDGTADDTISSYNNGVLGGSTPSLPDLLFPGLSTGMDFTNDLIYVTPIGGGLEIGANTNIRSGSWEAWVKPTAPLPGRIQRILFKERCLNNAYTPPGFSCTSQAGFNLLLNNDPVDTLTPRWEVEVFAGAGPSSLADYEVFGGTPVAGEWAYIVATHDGNTLRLYVNGVLVGSTFVGNVLADNTGRFCMGADCQTQSLAFNGIIDNVRVSHRPLSVAEIGHEYNRMRATPISENFYVQEVGGPKVSGNVSVANFRDNTTGDPRSRIEFRPNFATGNIPVYECLSSRPDGTIEDSFYTTRLRECDGYGSPWEDGVGGPHPGGGNWVYQKPAFYLPDQSTANLVDVWYYWAGSGVDPDGPSGPCPSITVQNHKYTTYVNWSQSQEEDVDADGCVEYSGPWGGEPVIFKAFGAQAPGTVPVHRYYAAKNSIGINGIDDFYTIDPDNEPRLQGASVYTYVGVEFYAYPDAGPVNQRVFAPDTIYELVMNENSPLIVSREGVNIIDGTPGGPATAPFKWQWETDDSICKIGFVEISPNPAVFKDIQHECVLANPICLDTSEVPKNIVASVYSNEGLPISSSILNVNWRQTVEFASGTHDSQFMTFEQVGEAGEVLHKEVVGVDYSHVVVDGTVMGIDLGRAEDIGVLDFSFCSAPWIGDGPDTAYYLDVPFDIKLSYCRDKVVGGAELLPNLPNPHIVNTQDPANLPGGGSNDLLTEHVFIVDSTASGGRTLSTDNPYFITALAALQTQLDSQGPFQFGDVINFTIESADPQGDSYLTRLIRQGPTDEQLPISFSFNERTGAFTWVADAHPSVDHNADGNPDYEINFQLDPSSPLVALGPLYLNFEDIVVIPDQPTPSIAFTTVEDSGGAVLIGLPAEGRNLTINYGDTLVFKAVGDAGCPGCVIRTFVWDFQDSGSTTFISSGPTYTAKHVFLQAGEHKVTIRLQNDRLMWSRPATVNILVLPKTAQNIVAPVVDTYMASIWDTIKTWFGAKVVGQAIVLPPINLRGSTVDDVVVGLGNRLIWDNTQVYDDIHIYISGVRPDGTPVASTDLFIAGDATEYHHGIVAPGDIGTEYHYRVCSVISTIESCTETDVVTRNIDVDIIVSRIFKNIDLLPVRDWYDRFAPNPAGSPREITIDGYPAIQDGTSVYIGIASCSQPGTTTCSPDIYSNVLLLSYNASATADTVEVFDRLISQMKINENLVFDYNGNSFESCSGNTTINCTTGHDAVCQANNAGICMSAKAKLRRDYQRVVDMHQMIFTLDNYGANNKFCNDGTNSVACETDLDCRLGNVCTSGFPVLTAGTYIGGMSLSVWPSWQNTLAGQLGYALPTDPFNILGGNFYTPSEVTCSAFPGFDNTTCWNDTTKAFKCHRGSSVYMYQNIAGTRYRISGQLEGQPSTASPPPAQPWNWPTLDSRIITNTNNICNEVVVGGSCGNGVLEGAEECEAGSKTLYCVNTFGGGPYNSDFLVGCDFDGVDNDPATPGDNCKWTDLALAEAACGGTCGETGALTASQINYPLEKCDNNGVRLPGADNILGTADDGVASLASQVSCTNGGTVSCSNTCQIACTRGAAYGGKCGNGIVELPEICDEGNPTIFPGGLNGTTGHCNLQCTGYDSFCGDGILNTIDVVQLGCLCDSNVDRWQLGGNTSCAYLGKHCTNAARNACNTNDDCIATGGGFCLEDYYTVPGADCALSCATGKAHQWSCREDREECEGVAGLTSYSCPSGTSLFCDNSCNRACTDTNPAVTNVDNKTKPVYEHYLRQGNSEDYTYDHRKTIDAPYITTGIVFYAYQPNDLTTSCPAVVIQGHLPPYPTFGMRTYEPVGDIIDRGKFYGGAPPIGYAAVTTSLELDICVFSASAIPGTRPDDAVPVYLFRSIKSHDGVGNGVCTNDAARSCSSNADCIGFGNCASDIDYYVSRSLIPRIDTLGNEYEYISYDNASTPDIEEGYFYAMLGPLQETCGNDIIEGNETCEPALYVTPDPRDSRDYHQYQCGEVLTPLACKVYGGFCGDGGQCVDTVTGTVTGFCETDRQCPTGSECNGLDAPFEECDGGPMKLTGGILKGICSNSPLPPSPSTDIPCANDFECGSGTCIGNGAFCDNTTGNCSYCATNCQLALLPRNFCDDGLINPGPDGIVCPDRPDGTCSSTSHSCLAAVDCPTAGDTCNFPALDPACADDLEICDDGLNNGRSGDLCNGSTCCNDTCSGLVGTVCGNGLHEKGEYCDDGPLNGTWTYTCSHDTSMTCSSDAQCDFAHDGVYDIPPSSLCNSAPFGYCNAACSGTTPARCGDGIIAPHADGFIETCDDEGQNGNPNRCNLRCDGITKSLCNNEIKEPCGKDGICGYSCEGTGVMCEDALGNPDSALCTGGEYCRDDGEECDFNGTRTVECTDIAVGSAGLRTDSCSNSCKLTSTTCHAFGLKIWSDDADVVYLNNSVDLYKNPATPLSCSLPSVVTGTDFYPVGNLCSALPDPSHVPFTPLTNVTDQYTVRPDPLLGEFWEIAGKNTIAFKVWDDDDLSRGVQAVYTSPSNEQQYILTTTAANRWVCTQKYQSNWFDLNCNNCSPGPGSSWQVPRTYTNASPITSPADHALCRTPYNDNIGGGAPWVWGSTCMGSCSVTTSQLCTLDSDCPAFESCSTPQTLYCRLDFEVFDLPSEAAWNWNYGWIRMKTRGSEVVLNNDCSTLFGAAWNTNLGWLFFDATAQDAFGNRRVDDPLYNNFDGLGFPTPPVSIDAGLGILQELHGFAWGTNYSMVNMWPHDLDPGACAGDTRCGVKRNPATGELSGYAWGPLIGWVNFAPDTSEIFLSAGQCSFRCMIDTSQACSTNAQCTGVGDSCANAP